MKGNKHRRFPFRQILFWLIPISLILVSSVPFFFFFFFSSVLILPVHQSDKHWQLTGLVPQGKKGGGRGWGRNNTSQQSFFLKTLFLELHAFTIKSQCSASVCFCEWTAATTAITKESFFQDDSILKICSATGGKNKTTWRTYSAHPQLQWKSSE